MTLEETKDKIYPLNTKNIVDAIESAAKQFGKVMRFIPVPDGISENDLYIYINAMRESGITDFEFAEKSGYKKFDVGILFQLSEEDAPVFKWLYQYWP